MSLSKDQLAGVAAELRQPKCTRCRHHGIVVPQKGHMRYCPFLRCSCWKCYLITQRTRIAALQRHLKKTQNKEQGPRVHTGVFVVKPAAEDTCSTSTADGGARPSSSLGPSQQSDKAPEQAATTPHHLRSRPDAGGEKVTGLDSGKVLPQGSREEGPCTPPNASYFGVFGQTAPLPVIHLPFTMPGQYPSSYVPWLAPVPAGLHAPVMFPLIQVGPVHFPPAPETGPPADCRPIFSSLQPPPLPEAVQEELMSRQRDLEEPDCQN